MDIAIKVVNGCGYPYSISLLQNNFKKPISVNDFCNAWTFNDDNHEKHTKAVSAGISRQRGLDKALDVLR